jgi:hypothetical protein
LRVWGFLCTALGAAMLGVGAILSWANVTIGIRGTTRSAATTAPGIDLPEGKVALAAALVALVAVVAMRLVESAVARRAWGVAIAAAGLIGGAAVLEALMRSQERIGGLIVGQKIAQLSGGRSLPPVVQQHLTDLANAATHIDLQPAIYIALFGAVLVLIGGILGLLWTPEPAPHATPPPDAAASGS